MEERGRRDETQNDDGTREKRARPEDAFDLPFRLAKCMRG